MAVKIRDIIRENDTAFNLLTFLSSLCRKATLVLMAMKLRNIVVTINNMVVPATSRVVHQWNILPMILSTCEM